MEENALVTLSDSFEYQLESPLYYSEAGQRTPSDKLTVYAPSGRQLYVAHRLEQVLFKAFHECHVLLKPLLEAVKSGEPLAEEVKKDGREYDSDQVASAMRGSSIDLEEAVNVFGLLAVDGCVKINNLPLNGIQWRDMVIEDQLNIFYEFCAFFIAPSTFAGSRRKLKQ